MRRRPGHAGAAQRRVVRALDHDEHVPREVLRGDEPRRSAHSREPADAEAAALAERVALEPAMAADDAALSRLDRAGPPGEPSPDEFAERPLADEADAGRVSFRGDRNPALAGDAPDLRLLQPADGKEAVRELRGIQRMQEVALVLARIEAAQEPPACGDPGVVSGREAVGAETARVVEPDPELHLAVAEHVRVRRPPGGELGEERREDALAVLAGEARTMQRDRELVADAARILEIGGRRAVAVVVLGPVRHEQRLDVVARVQQQRRRDCRVDAAGQRDDDARHDQPAACRSARPPSGT